MAETLRQETVDGIPAFIETRGGARVVGLAFRVGWADETLATHGITHLVEHLALFEATSRNLPVNGTVVAHQTTFVVRGTDDEVVEFLDILGAALAELPLQRLEGEARILDAEAEGRRPSAHSALLSWRYGATGYGLEGLPELGLRKAPQDPASVQEWSNRHFTAENAALWASGPLPENLRLALPAGSRVPSVVPRELPDVRPSWAADSGRITSASFVVDSSDAVGPASYILRRRLHERLRMQEARSYNVVVAIDAWARDWRHVMIAADSTQEDFEHVRDGILAEVGRLGATAPSVEELDEAATAAERNWTDPDAGAYIASGAATNHLIDRPNRSIAEAIAALRAVEPQHVSDIAMDMWGSMIMLVPPTVSVPDRRTTRMLGWSPAAVDGAPFRRSRRLPNATGDHTLVVGPEGLSYVHAADRLVTVLYSRCVAAQVWDDGSRQLWADDGSRVFVHPDEWVDARDAIRQIDAAVKPSLIVPMGPTCRSRYLDEVDRVEQQQRPVEPPKSGPLSRLRRRGSG
jgi:zinc protease